MRQAVFGVASALALVLASPSYATLVTSTNNADITYNVKTALVGPNGGGSTSLTATVEFSNFQFSIVNGNTVVTFDTDAANTTQQGTLTQAQLDSVRLTAFGYDTDPNALTGTDTSNIYDTYLNQNFPSFKKVEVCLSSGSNCAGGANGGLHPGDSDAFAETLTFAGTNVFTNGFDFGIGADEKLATKWQTGFGSFETSTNPNCPDCVITPVITVTEPGSLAALGGSLLGMAGIIGWRRRKNNG
jgi:LPXTG-motif cell wall-anchored protein